MALRCVFVLMALLAAACGADQGALEPDPLRDAGTGTDAGTSDTGAAADSGGDVEICDEVAVQASPVQPNVVLVVDKSGSMDEPTRSGSARTKMQDTKDALNQLLDFGTGRIRFGWSSFPIGDQCMPGIVSVVCDSDSIGDMVIPCDLALGVEPEWPDYLWVYFDGLPLSKDPSHQDGWDYDANLNQITMLLVVKV